MCVCVSELQADSGQDRADQGGGPFTPGHEEGPPPGPHRDDGALRHGRDRPQGSQGRQIEGQRSERWRGKRIAALLLGTDRAELLFMDMHMYVSEYVFLFLCICMYALVCVYMCMCLCGHVCVCVWACVFLLDLQSGVFLACPWSPSWSMTRAELQEPGSPSSCRG